MEIHVRSRMRLREIDQWCQARLARLEAVAREAEALRRELSQAEQEIAEVWESDLPRPNKLLLEQVMRVRCLQLQGALRCLQAEAAASAPPYRLSYRRRRE
jgi:hypothetical protein